MVNETPEVGPPFDGAENVIETGLTMRLPVTASGVMSSDTVIDRDGAPSADTVTWAV